MLNCKISEALAVLGAINPSPQAAGSLTTGWISLANAERILGVIQIGTFGASATVDANIQQATDTNGTGAKAITGKAIATMSSAEAGGNNVQATIDLRADELDTANGFCTVNLTITVGVAATETAGLLLAGGTRFAPASQFNAASVNQQVG
jgi:hypothetical protein